MNKSELVGKVAAQAGIAPAQAEQSISALFATIADVAKSGDKVTWPGFGSFAGKHRPARTGRNPSTQEPMNIPASTVMGFSAAKALKETLNS
ncbi:MAG: DNA-binding protein [Acidimicrobiaceae bacterium]|nr:DNA-binding protein [Acidimicrobiaceae bacterium]